MAVEHRAHLRSLAVGHEVDPDVDEARNYLVQDMLRSQGLEQIGWVKGVGAASQSEPHHMDDGTPFFTDGLRAVLFIATKPVPITRIDWLDWREEPMPAQRAILLGE